MRGNQVKQLVRSGLVRQPELFNYLFQELNTYVMIKRQPQVPRMETRNISSRPWLYTESLSSFGALRNRVKSRRNAVW